MTTKKFPRLAVVPCASVEWLSKAGRTPNRLRVLLEEIVNNGKNYQKYDWEFLFEFSLYIINFILITYYWFPPCFNLFPATTKKKQHSRGTIWRTWCKH